MSIYKSKGWLEKREKFLEGKVCEWCGSDRQLAIHHKNPSKVGLRAYNHVANEYYQEYFKDNKNESELNQCMKEAGEWVHWKFQKTCPRCHRASIRERTTMTPRYCCIKCGYEFDEPVDTITPKSEHKFWNQVLYIFRREHKDEIQKLYSDYKEKARVDYLDYSEEDMLVLCKKCHLMAGRGKILCSKCKKHYHDKKYKTCFTCSEDTYSYEHPWCGESFRVHKNYEGMTSTPEDCCINICPKDPDECSIAKNKSDVF